MIQMVLEFNGKVALIFAIAGLFLWGTRTRNAAGRHQVWTSVMVVMLLLPALLLWGPRSYVPVPSSLTQQVESVVRTPVGGEVVFPTKAGTKSLSGSTS